LRDKRQTRWASSLAGSCCFKCSEPNDDLQKSAAKTKRKTRQAKEQGLAAPEARRPTEALYQQATVRWPHEQSHKATHEGENTQPRFVVRFLPAEIWRASTELRDDLRHTTDVYCARARSYLIVIKTASE